MTKSFDRQDPDMSVAIANAKKSFGEFLRTFIAPKCTQTSFLVKVAIASEETVEHIWVADLDFSAPKPRGVIANDSSTTGLRLGQSLDFEPEQITDWMYIEDGLLVGGYTTRVIRNRMSPKERMEYDARAPYRFE